LTTEAPVRARHSGFTLIELLIVVVIISILASIAIPLLSHTKDKAYVASMKQDLHNLTIIEESYFFTYNTYTTTLPVGSFQSSKSNTVTITGADAQGWTAIVTNPLTIMSTPSTCGVFVGDGIPPGSIPADTIEGVPGCS
jgi:prepilin-type N-terminal cleavage/methylation domain-containing protein